jgi:protein-S-isoprenylcysteine O-methyltransferase Ste14
MGLAGWGLLLWAWHSLRREGVDLLGWRDLRRGHQSPPRLVTTGAYAFSRHPMYLGAALVLWARGTAPADLVTNLVLSAYLVLGACHEEARLRATFGSAYRAYARRVSFLGSCGKWRDRQAS